MTINVYELTDSKKLWFADKGTELRETILRHVARDKKRDLLKLDLREIEVTDSSFAREAFVNLITLLASEPERPQVLFANVDENLKGNLDQSFKEHKKFCLILDKSGAWDLIGKFSQQSVETVKLLLELKDAKARDIKKKLGQNIELSTVNNRLASLYEMCIVNRQAGAQETGGIEYTYSIQL